LIELLAGLGQHYMGKPFRGYVYNVAEIAGLLAALVGEVNRSNLRSDYLVAQRNYEAAFDPDEVARWRAEAERTYSDMEDMETLRNQGLLVAAGAIVVSVLDALLFFPKVAAAPAPVPPSSGTSFVAPDSAGDLGFHVGVSLRF